jgi:hypothetical protein
MATFAFHGATGDSLQCAIDSRAWGSCLGTATYGPLSVGPHLFGVRQTDAAGNVSSPALAYFVIGASTKAPACPMRLTFTLHRTHYGATTRVRVYINGKLTISRRGRNLTHLTISFTGSTSQTVRILAYDHHGLARTSVRVIHGCAKTAPKTKSRHGRHRTTK